MKKKITKEQCEGCENDFYNGKNPYNVEECWSFKDAKIIKRKKVALHDIPPWNWKPKLFPSCYKKKGFVYINCEKEDRNF